MIRFFRFCAALALATCTFITAPLCSHAQTQGLDFVPGTTRFDFTISGAPSWTVGYQFKTGGDITVYNLGFYDSGLAPLTYPGNGTTTMPNGFTDSHAVGIYDTLRGNLLVQAVVPQNSTLLDSNFRYAEQLMDSTGKTIIGPYILPALGTYIIAGVSNGENVTYVQNSHTELTHDVNVAYLHSVFQAGNSLFMPTVQDAAGGYFGPNFTTSGFKISGPPAGSLPDGTPAGGSPTPEPGPAAFALCAVVTGLLWRAKQLRRAGPAPSCS